MEAESGQSTMKGDAQVYSDSVSGAGNEMPVVMILE